MECKRVTYLNLKTARPLYSRGLNSMSSVTVKLFPVSHLQNMNRVALSSNQRLTLDALARFVLVSAAVRAKSGVVQSGSFET